MRKQELNKGQYGNWLKGVTGRCRSKIEEGRESGRGRGLGREQEKREQQEKERNSKDRSRRKVGTASRG